MKRLWILLVFSPVFAQKKPVTVDVVAELSRAQHAISAVWSADGTEFVYPQEHSLIVWDCAAKTSKTLVSTDAMEAAAVKGSESNAWQDRYARDAALEWAATGHELLSSAGGVLFLFHVDTGSWAQLTKTPEVEHDAKLSPDATSVAFRRENDLYVIDIKTGKETRLTSDGSPTLINGG